MWSVLCFAKCITNIVVSRIFQASSSLGIIFCEVDRLSKKIEIAKQICVSRNILVDRINIIG